jgi:hypothetical protein
VYKHLSFDETSKTEQNLPEKIKKAAKTLDIFNNNQMNAEIKRQL